MSLGPTCVMFFTLQDISHGWKCYIIYMSVPLLMMKSRYFSFSPHFAWWNPNSQQLWLRVTKLNHPKSATHWFGTLTLIHRHVHIPLLMIMRSANLWFCSVRNSNDMFDGYSCCWGLSPMFLPLWMKNDYSIIWFPTCSITVVLVPSCFPDEKNIFPLYPPLWYPICIVSLLYPIKSYSLYPHY